MKFTVKIAYIVSCYFFILLIEGGCICDCPEDIFFDYNSITAINNLKSIETANTNEYLDIEIRPSNIYFLTDNYATPAIFKKTALACSCVGQGGDGDKVSVVAINIAANKPFNDSLNANVLLNDLFEIEGNQEIEEYNPDYIYANLGELIPTLNMKFYYHKYDDETGIITLRLKARPFLINEPYQFTIQLIKSNGQILVTTSEPVSWY